MAESVLAGSVRQDERPARRAAEPSDVHVAPGIRRHKRVTADREPGLPRHPLGTSHEALRREESRVHRRAAVRAVHADKWTRGRITMANPSTDARIIP